MYGLEWHQIREVNDRETFPTRQQFKSLKDEIEQEQNNEELNQLEDSTSYIDKCNKTLLLLFLS
jgi:hypothetical protein